MRYDFELVGKIGSMALIRREDADIDYNIFSRLGSELKPGMIWVTSGAAEIGRLDYIKRTGRELTCAVLGDRALAVETLRRAVAGRSELSVQERPAANETDFLVTSAAQVDLTAAVFEAVADRRDALTLTALQAKTPTLEDIFMEITRGVTPTATQAPERGRAQA